TMLSTWFTRWLNARIEPFLVLPIGAGIVALTALFLALVRDEPWQMMLAIGVFGLHRDNFRRHAGAHHQGGAAPGDRQRDRAERRTALHRRIDRQRGEHRAPQQLYPVGARLPTNHGYTIAFIAAAVACLGAVVASVILTPRRMS
ncbi:MAG TPA: hypothetical protein VGR22_10955, partial [Thermomicrobiales bacterium]|nr:hypothetical protein [Thermomicrobiales bacterium]